MPSSSPSSGPLPTMCSPYIEHRSAYRQTDYHDGKSFRTVESRRRFPVVSASKSAQNIHTLASSSQEAQVISPSKRHEASSQASSLRSPSSAWQSKRNNHVTPRPPQKGKAQVVIVQGPVSASIELPKQNAMLSRVNTGLSTPPPTPNMERLPTPELDDFDERPFCDCCTGMQIVKYCAGCGCELDG